MKDKIKKAILKWDEQHISSLLEEDVESLTEVIIKKLSYTKTELVKLGRKFNKRIKE